MTNIDFNNLVCLTSMYGDLLKKFSKWVMFGGARPEHVQAHCSM